MLGELFVLLLTTWACKLTITTSGCYFLCTTFHTDSLFSRTSQDQTIIEVNKKDIITTSTSTSPCWININKGHIFLKCYGYCTCNWIDLLLLWLPLSTISISRRQCQWRIRQCTTSLSVLLFFIFFPLLFPFSFCC